MLLESVEEVLNNRNSDDQNMLGLDDSDSDEETESNQHHPLLSELLHSDSNCDFEPRTGSSHDMDDAVAQTTTSAAIPCTGSSRDMDDAVDSH